MRKCQVIGLGMLLGLATACGRDGGAPPGGPAPHASATAPQHPATPPAAPATPLTDPLAARAHLPMPWRLVGASFISQEKGDPGWAPGPMADGHSFVEFDFYGLIWRHADVEDHYACTLEENGAFQAVGPEGTKAQGRVDVASEELIWQGERYRIRTYDEIARDKEDAPPPHRPPGTAPFLAPPDKNTLVIDLRSEQQGWAHLDFAMGLLDAQYLGHHKGWAVLRIHTNIELGEGTMLYRLPIADGAADGAADGTATIQCKDGGMPTYSFDLTKGKRTLRGPSPGWGNGTGWTWKKEDFDHPANTTHYLFDPDGRASASVSTTDMQRGDGAEVRPGCKVRVRFWFYTDRDYLVLRPDAKQGEEVTFTVGAWKDRDIKTYLSDGVEKPMDGVFRGMKASGWRRAQIAQTLAGDLAALVPLQKAGTLYLEGNLLTIEPEAGTKDGG